MHPATIISFICLTILSSSQNISQVITVAKTGCNFLVRTQANFTFLYCNTPTILANINWTTCINECCPQQSNFNIPNLNILKICQSIESPQQNITITAIVIFSIISIIALAVFVCFCGIILKLLKSFYKNRVIQQMQESLTIEWEDEQKYLTISVEGVIWRRMGINLSVGGQSMCSICLEEGPNGFLCCGHTYHPLCIGLWLQKSNFCPLCHREDIRSIKIYCLSCRQYYFLCRRKFLIASAAILSSQCGRCSEKPKSSSVEVEDIQFRSQYLIFDSSSISNLASP